MRSKSNARALPLLVTAPLGRGSRAAPRLPVVDGQQDLVLRQAADDVIIISEPRRVAPTRSSGTLESVVWSSMVADSFTKLKVLKWFEKSRSW